MSQTLTRRELVAAIPAVAAGASTMAAVVIASTANADPIFAQIERHKVMHKHIETSPLMDDDELYLSACADKDTTFRTLDDMTPTTVAAAIAQLTYMAEVEELDAENTGRSPVVRCARRVAKALEGGLRA